LQRGLILPPLPIHSNLSAGLAFGCRAGLRSAPGPGSGALGRGRGSGSKRIICLSVQQPASACRS
jgi:hypothetical protein